MVSKACRYFGISRETFYQWKRAYAEHGEKAIEYGFQKIRLGKSKLPIRFDESEDKVFSVKSVKEFVLEVGKQVEQFEKLYKEQKAICESKK